MDPYVKLAKDNLESYIKKGLRISLPDNLPDEMLKKQAGTFVSIHTKDHGLRGCIGTFMPAEENIAQEIIENSISAATNDPRFSPITEKELDDLVINVDVLTEPVLVRDRSELDPKKYGVIVSTSSGKKGLLLPDLEGVDTVDQQIEICCQKGWIDREKEELVFHKFVVVRHEE